MQSYSVKIYTFFQKRLVEPLLAFLKQGVTPAKLALAITVGILISTFPVFGSHSALCLLLIYLLRLNGPVVFLINNLSYPLIFLTYIPLINFGSYMFNKAAKQISIDYVFALFNKGIFQAIIALWEVTVNAIFGWVLLALPSFLVIYFILLFIFKKVSKRLAKPQ